MPVASALGADAGAVAAQVVAAVHAQTEVLSVNRADENKRSGYQKYEHDGGHRQDGKQSYVMGSCVHWIIIRQTRLETGGRQ